MTKYQYPPVTITDRHSESNPKQKITIELRGGFIGEIWIDDKPYFIEQTSRGYKVKKSKPGF